LPTNEWTGPVSSPFGVHLVRVSGYVPGVVPPLETVRIAVAREWENERRVAARTEAYRKLRERYQVKVEPSRASSIAAR